jgi:Uma2 family endonuclease
VEIEDNSARFERFASLGRLSRRFLAGETARRGAGRACALLQLAAGCAVPAPDVLRAPGRLSAELEQGGDSQLEPGQEGGGKPVDELLHLAELRASPALDAARCIDDPVFLDAGFQSAPARRTLQRYEIAIDTRSRRDNGYDLKPGAAVAIAGLEGRRYARRWMAPVLPQARHRYSYEEYLAYERDSGMKHEYDNGEIVAMAGGSRRHNALASRVSAALEIARKPGCVAFQSDQRVRVLATGRTTYPDASMVCGPIEGDPADASGTTITNPTLIVEVLSPSTEQEDRGTKWQHYQLVPSLEEYVLVSQSHQRVESYRRLPSGSWEYRDATRGTVPLSSGATLDLERMYAELPD